MKKYKNTIPAFIILVFGFIISIGIHIKYKESKLATINNEIDLLIENKIAAVQHELVVCFSSLEFLKNLFEENSDISRASFTNYTSPLLKGARAAKALTWVPKIDNDERQKYESKLQREFNPNLTIWTRNKENERFTTQVRPVYFPVTFIEPISENIDAVGYDIYSSGTRKATINKAIENKALFITSRIKLVQDTAGYSFLGILPVYHSHDQQDAKAGEFGNLYGLITGAFKVNEIISVASRLASEYEMDLVIFDSTNKIKEQIYGDEKLLAGDVKSILKEIEVGGRKWAINFVVASKYYKVKDAWVYLIVGFSISLFLSILFLIPFIKEERSRKLSLKLNQEKKDRKVAEQILSESEEYNRTLFTQSSIGLALATMEGILVDINPAFANIIGRTIEETKKLSYWDITPKKYGEQEQEQLKLLKTTGEYGPYEKEYIHKSGGLIPVRLKGKILKQKGVEYIWSSVENISEKKKAENELMRLNRILNETGEIAKIGGWEYDVVSGKGSGTNEVARIYDVEFSNYADIEDELRFYTPESRAMIEKSMEEVVKNKKAYNITLELRSAKNIHKWVRVIGDPVIEDGKVIKVRGSIQDITKEKKAKQEIQQSDNRFRNMFNNALFGAVINQLLRDDSGKAIDFLHLEVNSATEKHLGAKPEDIIGKLASELVSEEEATYSIEVFSEVVEFGKPCQFEKYYPAYKKTIEISAFHLIDDLFVTTFIDISERKNYEQALINSESKFRALVEQSLTGIYIFEKERFLYVNKRFCEIFGYTEEEILNTLKPTDVVTRDEAPVATENINKRLKGEVDSVRYSAKGNHKEGKVLWIEIHGTHIKYEGNDVITGTVLDITERKLSEQRINNLNQELEGKVRSRTKELNDKLLELERLNGIFVNREFRIKELKDKINSLENNQK